MKNTPAMVASLLALVTACGGGQEDASQPPPGDRPQLRLPGSPAGFVEVQLPAKALQSYVHGSYTVCLDRAGEVEIDSIEFESGDLEVTGWAVRPNPAAAGGEFAGDRPGATLDSRGIETTDVLTMVCDEQGAASYEVVLQLESGESSTRGTNVVVHYTSEGAEGSLVMPDHVVLCVRPERPSCM